MANWKFPAVSHSQQKKVNASQFYQVKLIQLRQKTICLPTKLLCLNTEYLFLHLNLIDMKASRQTIVFYFILIAVTVLIKIICAPQINFSGFSSVIAVALFAGFTTKNKTEAFLLPLVTLFLSDMLLQLLHSLNFFPYSGFYSGQIYNYALFILITLIGIALRNYKTAGVFAATLIAPTIFFLISNFIVWKTQGLVMGYSNDLNGLIQSYTFGLPFYRNSLIATIIFLPSFIALYHLMKYGKLSLLTAPTK